MNDTYVEWLVKKKTPGYMTFLKFVCFMLTACFILIGFVFVVALIIGAVFAVISYFLYLNCDLEYEYLYVDKELTVEKVMAKSKRKKVAVFDINKMEILAPIKSYHLDNFKHRTDKTVDYSSGEEKQPDHRFVFYYDGRQRVVIEPNPELIKAIQTVAPRKVFID